MKKCSKCGEHKAQDEFYKNRAEKTGYQSECKQCNRTMSRAAYHRKKATGQVRQRVRDSEKESARYARYIATDHAQQLKRDRESEERTRLSDRYVRIVLLGKQSHKGVVVPAGLLALKREQLATWRALTELRKSLINKESANGN